ncbi:MAG: SRPBCC family protein [Planctomycetota bacterium]
MGRTTVSRTIHAPIETVFNTVAHIDNFSKAVPAIVKVEFLSDVRSGVGTRFRETRLMGRREASTELEVTEYAENEHIRLVTDTGGTVWDTVFTVRPVSEGGVELTMVMDANAHKLLAKLMNPLIKGIIRKAIEKDTDAVKAHCEKMAG